MSRKKSREKAMEILFSMSLTKDAPNEAVESFVENYEEDIKELDLDYINNILNGIENNNFLQTKRHSSQMTVMPFYCVYIT